jgi:hypothetical protein
MMKLTDFEFAIDFPQRRNVVYVLFYGDNEKPFYVGETESFTGRMADYLRGTFAAATDFKVGEAIRYLEQHVLRIRVGYQEHPDRPTARAREDEFIVCLRSEGIPLLNDLAGYNYRTADKVDERSRVHKFCDNLILNRAVRDHRGVRTI